MMDLPGHFSEALVTAVLETFENLAFMEPEYRPEKTERIFVEALCCNLPIRAPLQGDMEIAMNKDLAALIAGTIWSVQKTAVDEQMCKDTVAELLNTIAGRFMKAIVPEDQVFELGLPKMSLCTAVTSEDRRPYPFILDGEVFLLSLKI
jgi:CheY-specific phosphatase CheX